MHFNIVRNMFLHLKCDVSTFTPSSCLGKKNKPAPIKLITYRLIDIFYKTELFQRFYLNIYNYSFLFIKSHIFKNVLLFSHSCVINPRHEVTFHITL